jgi:phospho-N-acetylmuramoyl-pentapeptide-transferase
MREILISGALALFISLFGTPILMKFLARRGYGQIIRDDGPSSHHTKRGTPTMGGLIIIFAAATGYFVAHAISQNAVTTSALLVLGLMASLGFVGFLDDWLKVSRQLVIVWVVLMVTATSNGVNLTDGLDGLATGAAVMTFIAYILIGVWQFGQSCAIAPGDNCYLVRDPLDLAVLSAALAGACAGFLWWNASPAKIFMGDTGSLALGGALAGIATSLRIELLLIPLGGLFVIISASVILQVAYFKVTGGKRIFKMAPLQHHFELMGWGEVTIVLRFWIIAGLCVALGLGLFYAQWVTQ